MQRSQLQCTVPTYRSAEPAETNVFLLLGCESLGIKAHPNSNKAKTTTTLLINQNKKLTSCSLEQYNEMNE